MFHVKKRTLLLIAGVVWLIAGFNVARLGVLSYRNDNFRRDICRVGVVLLSLLRHGTRLLRDSDICRSNAALVLGQAARDHVGARHLLQHRALRAVFCARHCRAPA